METKQVWDEKLMWQKILSKDLMELKDDEEVRKFAQDYCQKLYSEDRNRFSDASELIRRLGIGGLWRGIDIAIMLVAKKLQDHSKFFTQPQKPKVCGKCYGQIVDGKCRGKCNPYTPKIAQVAA